MTKDCSCDLKEEILVVQCRSCNSCYGECNIEAKREMTQKRIWKQVRVQSSLFSMALSAVNVGGSSTNQPLPEYGLVNWNQSSDRNKPAIQQKVVPSHGNSTRYSLTRNRPGASSPGGKGVDIKHNSYDRYLARRKSNLVKSQLTSTQAIMGDKTQTYGMLSKNCTSC